VDVDRQVRRGVVLGQALWSATFTVDTTSMSPHRLDPTAKSHAEAVPSVPSTLRDAVAAWEARGRPEQGATEYDRLRWCDALPEHAGLVRDLPERLNRSETRRIVSGLLERADIVEAFLVSQIWGYGRRGYGPYRVGRILGQADAARRLRCAYDTLVEEGPVAAFGAFSDAHRLTGLGPAFFTKFMFFADRTGQAVVLDDYVATWLREHAGVELVLYPPRSSAYAEYLALIRRWSATLSLRVDEVEQLIFAAQARTRPRNDWVP
jgi:hypothetical protein